MLEVRFTFMVGHVNEFSIGYNVKRISLEAKYTNN